MSVAEVQEPDDLYITPILYRREPKNTNHFVEKLALQDIAAQMVDHPERVLPKLVERAMQLTGATSAGISVFEPREGTPGLFRWRDLRGALSIFDGMTTPRNYSPCGVCLDRSEVTLTRHPERYYDWIAATGVKCPEVLLIPLYIAHAQPLGTLWIVANQEGDFDSGHARTMRELAAFVGVAIAMLQDKQRLQEAIERYENAVRQQEMLTAEMNHRMKNLFSIVDAMIRLSKRSAKSVADMAESLSGRLHAMGAAHALVGRSFGADTQQMSLQTATLRGVIEAVLKPYDTQGAARFVVTGPEIELGAEAATSLALLIHEFATNAAKYGALTRDEGVVTICWERKDSTVVLQWHESGGPAIIGSPAQSGFGSTLVRNTVAHLQGLFTLNWRNQGLAACFEFSTARLLE